MTADVTSPIITDPRESATFDLRLDRYGADILKSLTAVYGDRAPDLFERMKSHLAEAFANRGPLLKRLDEARLLAPDWLQTPDMIGYVTYADRFNGTLNGLGEKLDYLSGLGVKYLHLMPALKPREGESDGGYAVQNYREIRPDLGTMDDLARLTGSLRERGISLVMDLVLNHVAQEHEWAERARAGERKYRDYFYIYPDRTIPDQYEEALPEVFPDFAPGNFTWDDDINGWVWTTFNSYQWDVNWTNPDVFLEYLDIICFLANQGVEVIRLDAIAFIWKRMGTSSQNQPEVHHLTEALRGALRIVAPAVAFKAEAIVGPSDLIYYLGVGSHYGKVSDMAYHNGLMVQLWSALASRDTRLTEVALSAFRAKPTSTTWGTYARCHDDIGWAISDEDAADAQLDGYSHRVFLSDFYSGEYPGSFAKGLVFQFNPVTNDRRISGTFASLTGLEQALELGDGNRVDDAVDRILLLHAVMFGFGGVPLLYMGDELGMLNDYGYADDPDHASDNRWAHRPKMDWDLVQQAADDPSSPAGRISARLRHLIEVRKHTPHLHASIESHVVPSPDSRLLLLHRSHPEGEMMQIYNFSEHPVNLDCSALRFTLGSEAKELISGYDYDLSPWTLTVQPYQALWLLEKVVPPTMHP